MLTKQSVSLIILVLMIGLLLRQPVLVLLCGLVLLAAGVALGWRRWALAGVAYERILDVDHVFPGDEVMLETRVVNRKLLPVAQLEMLERVPSELQIAGARIVTHGQGMHAFTRTLSLGWYEAVTRRYRIQCPQRGVYQIGPVRLRAGDPFGFFTNERNDSGRLRLVVYPRLLARDQMPFDLRLLLGDLRSQQRLIVDPSRTVGIRDYQRDDPLKQIHWNATARRGQLQTRVYEPTTNLQVMCFLDVSTFDMAWAGIAPDEAERLISTAATIMTRLADQGQSVGFVTNGVTTEQATMVRVEPSRSPFQATRILETLASLRPYAFVSMARLLRIVPPTLPAGTSVVLISTISPAPLQDALLRLHQRGHAVRWVFLGEAAPAVPGIGVWHAPPQPDESVLEKELR